jgi:hypothetical protein
MVVMETAHEQAGLRSRAGREELVQRVAHANRQDGIVEPIPGLHLNRVSRASERLHGILLQPRLQEALRALSGTRRGAAAGEPRRVARHARI